MPKKTKARITALGSYLPETVLSNKDLEKMVDTSDEWIVSRTGMKERRIARIDEFPSDMGAKAAELALKNGKVAPEKVDLLIVATMTPDYLSSSTAALIQAKVGATNAAAFDIQAACTGFLYALAQAKAFIEAGLYHTILVIATEKMSAFIDYKDRNTCVLFGDGASAAIVSGKGHGFVMDTFCLGADGERADLFIAPGGGSRMPATLETVEKGLHKIRMDGKEIFKHAVRRMGHAAQQCLEKAGIKSGDIAWMVPHQANSRIIDAIAKAFHIPHEKVFKTIHKYGNTSASSIAIALDELTQQEKMTAGTHLLLVAFGAGLTWGAAILTKINDD